jgi:hypothetical protein
MFYFLYVPVYIFNTLIISVKPKDNLDSKVEFSLTEKVTTFNALFKLIIIYVQNASLFVSF